MANALAPRSCCPPTPRGSSRTSARRSGARAASGGLPIRLRWRRGSDPADRRRNAVRLASSISRCRSTLGINPIADFRLFREYRRLLRDLRPAAYLGFTIKPNVYGSLAAELAECHEIPNVSGIGNAFMWGGPVQQVVRWLSRLAFRRARVVFFQNADDCRFLPSGGSFDRARREYCPALVSIWRGSRRPSLRPERPPRSCSSAGWSATRACLNISKPRGLSLAAPECALPDPRPDRR